MVIDALFGLHEFDRFGVPHCFIGFSEAISPHLGDFNGLYAERNLDQTALFYACIA